MHDHNLTLHKRSLARKRLIRQWLNRGRKPKSIAKQLGISAFFFKPFQEKEVARLVREILDAGRADT